MTRQDARNNLIGFGIAEPTDEQVTNYLNQVNGESQKEKAKAEQYKRDAEKVAELSNKLAEMEKAKADIENANLTDIEKANKAAEEANAKVVELQRQIEMNAKRSDALKKLGEMGITGDNAEALINSNGEISDYEALGKVLAEIKTDAANAKEQEIANNSTNPNGGGSVNKGGDDKPADLKYIEGISFVNSASAETKDYYKI